jgi:hypothetical protein
VIVRIDVTRGSVSFAEGAVGPDLDRPAFLRTRIGSAAKMALVNAGWVNFDIDPEPGVTGTVMFKDDRLRQILLLMRIPSDDAPEWTEKLEQARKLKHDEWLRAELGAPPYEYLWGRITSDFDPRGCVSEIIVSYAE